MATVLDRVPVERVAARAKNITLGAALLAIVTGLLFAVGWGVRKLLHLLWVPLAWTWAALAEGWVQASKTDGGG